MSGRHGLDTNAIKRAFEFTLDETTGEVYAVTAEEHPEPTGIYVAAEDLERVRAAARRDALKAGES